VLLSQYQLVWLNALAAHFPTLLKIIALKNIKKYAGLNVAANDLKYSQVYIIYRIIYNLPM